VAQAGVPFPNLPNTVGSAFASAAQFGDLFGVGVNGFFFRNSLPPNTLLAKGSFAQTITNSSTVSESVVVDFFIPRSTISFFGVGNSFPAGADPARDASAAVSTRMVAKITHPDGSSDETVFLDYGMQIFREQTSGELKPIASRDAFGAVLGPVFNFDGSFDFTLPELDVDNVSLAPFLPPLHPGEVMEFSYDYFATASTGFGETGIFAAIGDPFDLSAGGGRVLLMAGPSSPEPGIPEPGTLTMLGLGLFLISVSARRVSRPSRLLYS